MKKQKTAEAGDASSYEYSGARKVNGVVVVLILASSSQIEIERVYQNKYMNNLMKPKEAFRRTEILYCFSSVTSLNKDQARQRTSPQRKAL